MKQQQKDHEPQPLTWRSARTPDERAGLLAEAAALGNRTVAAEALDISRQHMHRLLNERATKPRPGRLTLSVALDRELVEWLDVQAVHLKHRTGARQAGKAEVLAELIREAMGRRP